VIKEYGADVLMPVKFKSNGALLTLVLALALPVEKAKEMAQTLLALGATSAQADINGSTAFHRYVEANAESLLESLWETDPVGAKTAINHMSFVDSSTCETPLQLAAKEGNLALVLKLLEHGAVTHIDFESWYVYCDHGLYFYFKAADQRLI
jgi:ankyrin repeat protein